MVVVQGDVRLALLHPEVGAQHLQRTPVGPDGLRQARHLEQRDVARVETAGRDDDEFGLPQDARQRRRHLGRRREIRPHPFDGKTPPRMGGLVLAGHLHPVGVAEDQLARRAGRRVQAAGWRADEPRDGVQAGREGAPARRPGDDASGRAEDRRRQQQVAQTMAGRVERRPRAPGRHVDAERAQAFRQRRRAGRAQPGAQQAQRVAQVGLPSLVPGKPVREDLLHQADDREDLGVGQAVHALQALAQHEGHQGLPQVPDADHRPLADQPAGGAAVVGRADHHMETRENLFEADERPPRPVRHARVAADDRRHARAAAEDHHAAILAVEMKHPAREVPHAFGETVLRLAAAQDIVQQGLHGRAGRIVPGRALPRRSGQASLHPRGTC